jgi:hypothetical protein
MPNLVHARMEKVRVCLYWDRERLFYVPKELISNYLFLFFSLIGIRLRLGHSGQMLKLKL